MLGSLIGALAGGFIGSKLATPKVEIHEHYSERRSSGYSVFYDNHEAMKRELTLARKAHDKLMAQQEMAVQNTEEIKALLQMNLRIALMTEDEKLEFRRQMAEYEAKQCVGDLREAVALCLLGETPMNKLTEEHCKFVAMTCKTVKEFWSKHRSVAMKAADKGWYSSYTWLRRERVPRNFWTYEACLAEASKYSTIAEFRANSSSAYVTANQKGWLKHFGLKRGMGEKHFWTEDTCRTEALKYKTLGDFRNGSPSAYYMAVHKGWISSFTFLERQRKIRKKKEN